jgi:hypothetical protein
MMLKDCEPTGKPTHNNENSLTCKALKVTGKSGKTYNISECLLPFLGYDYKSQDKLPDTLVSAIVTHYACYANRTNQIAKRNLSLFVAIGLRSYLREITGFKQEKESFETKLHPYLDRVSEILSSHATVINDNAIKSQSFFSEIINLTIDQSEAFIKLTELNGIILDRLEKIESRLSI